MHPENAFEEEMMSQRFTLFYAGYTAFAPALYFSRCKLLEDARAVEDKLLSDLISGLSEQLQQDVYECDTHLKTAISVAQQLKIDILPMPVDNETYFHWLHHYVECFEIQYPMARIDHYYFLFARKIAEMRCNMELFATYTSFFLRSNRSFDLERQMDKCIKDTEFILFKLMAATALLSSEPRQNYFNTYYKSLCTEFDVLKNNAILQASDKELELLILAAKNYDTVVMDGFKKCVGLLKELDI